MKLFTKILVPTDFSQHSVEASRYATQLARLLDAALCFVHVYEVMPYATPDVMPTLDALQITQLRDALQKQLEGAQRGAVETGARQVETLLLQGATASEIARVAEEQGFDLIVMGTHGRTGLAHILLGSVAEKVVRKSPCPVLTVPSKDAFQVHSTS